MKVYYKDCDGDIWGFNHGNQTFNLYRNSIGWDGEWDGYDKDDEDEIVSTYTHIKYITRQFNAVSITKSQAFLEII